VALRRRRRLAARAGGGGGSGSGSASSWGRRGGVTWGCGWVWPFRSCRRALLAWTRVCLMRGGQQAAGTGGWWSLLEPGQGGVGVGAARPRRFWLDAIGARCGTLRVPRGHTSSGERGAAVRGETRSLRRRETRIRDRSFVSVSFVEKKVQDIFLFST
jgi:hypothetical protein